LDKLLHAGHVCRVCVPGGCVSGSAGHAQEVDIACLDVHCGTGPGTLPRWPIFAGGLEAGRNYAIGGLLVMFALLIIYDFVTRRRPHPVSLIGMVGILASIAGAVFLGVTGIGYHWING
jgi:hypothetical protein